ncbi:MAG TPA: hypothetical protein VJU83_01860, partial [Burkholderiales bacterium]|nr:hypothetical protein [Burkholderiales bacterium]
MSLLLDALKRAEQAKEGSGDKNPEAPSLEALDFEPMSTPQQIEPPQLITRDRLPDISQSLEILADDLSPPPLLRRPKEQRLNGLSLKTPSATESADAEAQAAVRRVFQVKENTSNPKRPFYIIVGALVFAAIA